jgi:hypothetical protein
VNDFDDLDGLERELGPPLRAALRRAAADITDEPEGQPALIDATTPLLRASDESKPTRVVVDIQPMPRPRNRRPRLFAAAAVTAVVLIAGAALVTQSGDDAIRTKPADPNATSAPSPSSTSTIVPPPPPTSIVEVPTTLPGDGSSTQPLVLEGAPSIPQTGELVAHAAVIHNGTFYLYADGRLIFIDDSLGTSWSEQRLTPEGVERVRSLFLSSGLFDPTRASDVCPEDETVTAVIAACVRDGDHFLTLPYTDPRIGQLVTVLRTLGQTLLPTEWADRQIKPYVPSRMAVCMGRYITKYEVPLDLPALFPKFPAAVAQLLDGRAPRPDLAVAASGSGSMGSCFEVTHEEARALRDAFLDPAGGGTHEYWGIVVRLTPPDPARPAVVYVGFGELLPDGAPALWGG